MKLGRIVGAVMCTKKHPALEGLKLLLLQPVDEGGKDYGDPLIACDTVQAGPGDLVLWEGGREAAMALNGWFTPADARPVMVASWTGWKAS